MFSSVCTCTEYHINTCVKRNKKKRNNKTLRLNKGQIAMQLNQMILFFNESDILQN